MDAYANNPVPTYERPIAIKRRHSEHISSSSRLAIVEPFSPVEQLTRRRSELREQMAQLEQDEVAAQSPWSADLAEEAQDQQHRQRVAAMRRIMEAELAQVEHALERAARGLYGLCEDCGQAIARRRLQVVPWATLCIDCQAHSEARGVH